MALIADRAGEVQVRVGGNTQDYAKLVDTIPDGRILEKEIVDTNNPVCHLSKGKDVLLRLPLDRNAEYHLHR